MSEVINFNSKEFQHWFEDTFQNLARENNVTSLVMATMLDNGQCGLVYYNADIGKLRVMAHSILDEANIQVLRMEKFREESENME